MQEGGKQLFEEKQKLVDAKQAIKDAQRERNTYFFDYTEEKKAKLAAYAKLVDL